MERVEERDGGLRAVVVYREVERGRRGTRGSDGGREGERGELRRRAGRHRQKWTGKSDSTSFHFQRARSLARSLADSFRTFRSLTLALIRRFMQPASSPRTKIGNTAVFAERPGPSRCLAREFRGDEHPRPKSSR